MARIQRISPFLVIFAMMALGALATFIADARDVRAAVDSSAVGLTAPPIDAYSFAGAESAAVLNPGYPY